MSILDETYIAKDVYRFTSLDEQKEILKELDHEDDFQDDSDAGIIIVRHEHGNYGPSWTEVQIIDKEEIYL